MANAISRSGDGDIVHAWVSGIMTLADQRALETYARKLLEDHRQVRLLVTLEDFQGWEKNDAWGDDLEFQFTHGSQISRIAIVGSPRWKEPALLFVGKGFRGTDIEFFRSDARAEAKAWISRQPHDPGNR